LFDSAKRYNELFEEEDSRFRGLVKDYEPQLPAYSRKDKPMTREEEKQGYLMTKNTPGGFAMRLKEGTAKFGKKRAVMDILDWAARNERG
jgi:hypothetical protein